MFDNDEQGILLLERYDFRLKITYWVNMEAKTLAYFCFQYNMISVHHLTVFVILMILTIILLTMKERIIFFEQSWRLI